MADFNVKFQNSPVLNASFGEVQRVSDGGFERGYASGYKDGQSIGIEEGYRNGYEAGKTEGENEIRNELQPTIDGLIDKTVVHVESNAKTIPQMGLYSCSMLQTAIFPNVELVGSMAMYGCRVLTKAIIPNLKIIEASGMHDCNILPELDCRLERVAANAFCGCQQLRKLVIRTETVCFLEGDPFPATPMQNGDGYIYVPDSLIESYRAANVWATYAAQIKPLSELEGNA